MLAGAAGMGVSGVSQIETGARNPSAATLAKIAEALGVEVADLFPKGQAPLPNVDVGERRSHITEALDAYIRQRADRYERELADPNSPHFRNAATATLWVAQIKQEAADFEGWAQTEAPTLLPNASDLEELWEYLRQLLLQRLQLHLIADRAQERIQRMRDQPDELSRRRLEAAAEAEQENRRRLGIGKRQIAGE